MAESNDSLVTVSTNSSLNKDTNDSTPQEEDVGQEKVFIPTLVYESTLQQLPPNLHMIIEHLSDFGGSNINKTDLIVTIFYVLMLETGFVPKDVNSDIVCVDFHKKRVHSFIELPSNWKNSLMHTYSIDFILQPFPNRVCKMFCVCVNRNINVNIIIDSKCVCIFEVRVLRYVVSEEATEIPLKFRNLRELSIDFKNNISNKAKSVILGDEDITDAVFQDLPSEILYNIFKYLRIKDFVRLSCTCLRLKECANYFEDKIWKHYLHRDFPNAVDSNGESVCKWKEKYKLTYATEKGRQDRTSIRNRHGFLWNRHLY